MEKTWEELSPDEKQEAQFQKLLAPKDPEGNDLKFQSPEAEAAYEVPGRTAMPSTVKRLLPWAVAAVLAIALAAAQWGPWPSNRGESENLRFSIELPAEKTIFRGYGSSAVLSPDGEQLETLRSLGYIQN